MSRNFFKLAVFSLMTVFLAGCATTRARKAEMPDADKQMATMQSQLQALEQENQELRAQVESQEQSLSNNFSSAPASGKSEDILRVSGVSATQLQKALRRAGFDPGPVDGRIGKKTRSAVKAFQRRSNLKADGVVGERTWAALQSA